MGGVGLSKIRKEEVDLLAVAVGRDGIKVDEINKDVTSANGKVGFVVEVKGVDDGYEFVSSRGLFVEYDNEGFVRCSQLSLLGGCFA